MKFPGRDIGCRRTSRLAFCELAKHSGRSGCSSNGCFSAAVKRNPDSGSDFSSCADSHCNYNGQALFLPRYERQGASGI